MGGEVATGINKSPRHSLPGDFQPKPYHNVSADALTET